MEDTHPECFHCHPKDPIWPIDTNNLPAWTIDVCHQEALVDDNDLAYRAHLKTDSLYKEKVARRQSEEKEQRAKVLRDQRVERLRNITKKSQTLLNLKSGGSEMSKTKAQVPVVPAKKESKTGMIDRLIKGDEQGSGIGNKDEHTGSYATGALKAIAQQVLDASNAGLLDKNEVLNLKGLKGLAFSRRAVIARAFRERAAAQSESTEPVTA